MGGDYLETRVVFNSPTKTDKKGNAVSIVYTLDDFNKEFGTWEEKDGEDVLVGVPDDAPQIQKSQIFTFREINDETNPLEWLAQNITNVDIQRDLINRAVVLKQQQKALRLLTSDDFVVTEEPHDLGVYLNEVSLRTPADPKKKALREVAKAFGLAQDELDQLAQLLSGGFAASVTGGQEAMEVSA